MDQQQNPFDSYSSDDRDDIRQQLSTLRQSGKLNPQQSAGVDRALGFLNPQPLKPVSPSASSTPSSVFDDEHLGKAIGWLGENINPIVQAPVKMGEAGAELMSGMVNAAPADGKTGLSMPDERSAAERGIQKGVGSTIGSTVGNPTNWPFFLMGGGAVRPLIQRTMAAGFAGQMAKGAVEQAGQLGAVLDNPDVTTEQKYEMGTGAVIGTAMAGMAGSGILHRDVPPTPERPVVEARPAPEVTEAAPAASAVPPPPPTPKKARVVRPSPKPAEAADVSQSVAPPETNAISSETQPAEAAVVPPPPSPKERSIAQATRPSSETLAALKDEQETRTLSNLAAYGETKAKLRDVQREIDGAEAAAAGNFDRGARTPDELSMLKAQAESLKSTAITELKTHAAGLTDEEAQSLITSIEAPLYKLFGQATQLHRLVTDDPAAKQIRRVLVADVSRTGLPPDLEEIASKHLNEQIVGGRLTREVGGQRDRLFEQLGVYRDPSKQIIKVIKRMPTGEAGERIKARIEETRAKLSAMRGHSEPAMQRKIDHLLTQNVIMTDGRVRQKPTAVADQFTSVALSGKFHEISADNLKAVLGKKAVPDLVGRMSPEEIEIAKNLQGTEEGLKVRQEAARRNVSELRDKAIARVSENMRLVKAIKEARRVPEGSLTPLETSVAALMDQVQRQKEGAKEAQVASPKPALAAAPAAVETAAKAKEAAASEKLPLVDKLQGVVDRLKRGDTVDYEKLKAVEDAGIVKTLGRSNGQIADDLQLKVNRMRGRQKGAETLAAKRAAAVGAEVTETAVKTPQPQKPVSPEAQAADASMQALKAKTDAAILEKKLAAYDQISTMLKTAQHIPQDILKRTRAKLSLPDDVGPGKLAASIDAYTREIRERQAPPPAGLASDVAKTGSRAEVEKPSAPAPAASAALTPEETAVYQRAKTLEGDIQKLGTDHVEAIEKMRDAVKALGGTRLERYLSYERGLDAYHDAVQKQDPWAYKKALDAAKQKSQAGVLGESPKINASVEQQRDVAKFWSAATLGRYEKMSESQLARFKDRVFGPELEKMVTESGDPKMQQRLAALQDRAGAPTDPITNLTQVLGGKEFSADDLVKADLRENRGVLAREKEQLFHELDKTPTRAEAGLNPIAYSWEYLKRQVRLTSKLESVVDRWDRASVHDSVGFIDASQRGDFSKITNPEDRAVAVRLHEMFDERWDELVKLHPESEQNYMEHYFPNLWSNVSKARTVFSSLSRAGLNASADFLKQRKYKYFTDGLEAGLEPVTYNPVKLSLMRLHEMDRYLYLNKALDAFKKHGVAKFYRFSQDKPMGWEPVNAPMFQPKFKNEAGEIVQTGAYYMPAPAAKVMNNYLAPGLKEQFKTYDIVRNYSNLLNQSQLGLSAFHVQFTAMDAAISMGALGLKKISRLNPIDMAQGVRLIAKSLAPWAPIEVAVRGNRLLANYLDPGRYQDLAHLSSAVELAGGRAFMDPIYKNSAIEKFWNAIKEMPETPGLKKAPQAAKIALRGMGAGLELAAKPIMEFTVPRMKLGVFSMMAEDIFHKYGIAKQELEPGVYYEKGFIGTTNVPKEIVRQELQKAWDSVDNRMGQLVYENLFWSKVAKDMAMVTMRSPGWNIGLAREAGGGIKDAPKYGFDLGQRLKGKDVTPELTHRTSYLFMLPIITGYYGALMTMYFTGHGPQKMVDYWFPPTGKKDENGADERVSLASYMRDYYAIRHKPGETVLHKMQPGLSLMSEFYRNQDFYGSQIYDSTDDSPHGRFKLGLDVGTHIAAQFEPFSSRNFRERRKSDASIANAASSFVGVLPAPKYVGRSDAENLAYELSQRQMPQGPRDQILAARSQAIRTLTHQFMNGAIDVDGVFRQVDAGKITADDADKILDAKTQAPLERYLSRLPAHDAMRVWQKANHDERDLMMPEMLSKWDNLEGTYSGPQLDALQKSFQQEVGNHR